MRGWAWIWFVQVRLLTNLVPSLASGDRSRAAPDGIRLLRGEIAFFRLLGGELLRSTGRDCVRSFIGWGRMPRLGGMNPLYPSFACIVLENKKGALPFGGRLLFITERVAPVFLQKWWGDYFRNLKLATIGGSIAVPLQTRKKQMRLRTIAMTIQIPITIQPRKGMTARTNESAVTTWIFRA